jgi:hypothetical protein
MPLARFEELTTPRALKPGGWIDCSEPGLYFESFYDTLGEDHAYKTWGTAMLEAGNNAGMSFDVGPYMKQWLEDAGFINVKERRFCCTIGKWSNDAWERDVGVWEQRKINLDHVHFILRPRQCHRSFPGANMFFIAVRLERGVQDFCERRFMNHLGVSLAPGDVQPKTNAKGQQWRAEEVAVFCAKMRTALRNNKLLAHHWL